MPNRRLVVLALVGVVLIIVGLTAARMITVANTLNAAAAYAAAHAGELPIPQPLPASTAYAEPPIKVEAVARYGDAVDVQMTRRYKTLRNPEAQFTVTYFYQPAGNGWQLVSMPDSFWGEPQSTITGARLIIHHPQRDSKVAQNLLKVADPALQAACEQWACPPGITIALQFAPAQNVGGELAFPSPRFTGVPSSLEANDDYLSSLTANAVLALAKQLGQPAAAAQAEIKRLNLYIP